MHEAYTFPTSSDFFHNFFLPSFAFLGTSERVSGIRAHFATHEIASKVKSAVKWCSHVFKFSTFHHFAIFSRAGAAIAASLHLAVDRCHVFEFRFNHFFDENGFSMIT